MERLRLTEYTFCFDPERQMVHEPAEALSTAVFNLRQRAVELGAVQCAAPPLEVDPGAHVRDPNAKQTHETVDCTDVRVTRFFDICDNQHVTRVELDVLKP